MLEHVRSKKVLRLLMDIFNPIVVATYITNINGRTVEIIKGAGLSNIHVTNLWRDIVKKIIVYQAK